MPSRRRSKRWKTGCTRNIGTCAQDAEYLPAPQSFFDAAQECSARVSILGSTFYEDMACCGYNPQRGQFACPVRIKQTFGFGPAPFPGSREHVLTCVQQPGGGFVPVARDSVHLADEIWGQQADVAVRGGRAGVAESADGAAAERPDALCAIDPLLGAGPHPLRLQTDLGQRHRLFHPLGSVSRH